MAKYAVLIYGDEASLADGGEGMVEQLLKEHNTFGEANATALRGGEALQPTATATSIRRDGAGGFVITDGPFAETKEALGGFYLIEADDLDQAIAVAKQVPAPFGGVEVRPLMVFD